MSKRKVLRFVAVFSAFTVLILCSACGAPKKAKDLTPAFTPNKVVVLPFLRVDVKSAQNGMVRSPLTGSAFSVKGSEAGVEGLTSLDRALSNNLESWADFEYIPSSLSGKIFSVLRRREIGAPLVQIVQKTGNSFKADAVMVGHLYRFSRRIGGSMSAEKPASVAFDLAVVRVRDGEVIWKNSFDETQKSLSENIFDIGQYLKHGIRWYTAEELATYGMDTLLVRFPWRRQTEPIAEERE